MLRSNLTALAKDMAEMKSMQENLMDENERYQQLLNESAPQESYLATVKEEALQPAPMVTDTIDCEAGQLTMNDLTMLDLHDITAKSGHGGDGRTYGELVELVEIHQDQICMYQCQISSLQMYISSIVG